ncbi:hypothetical protein LSH36_660g04006, partial [Paralvinella palmiformis]
WERQALSDVPFLSVRCVVLPSPKSWLKYSAANLTKSNGLSRSTATVKSCSKSIKPGGISKFIVGLSMTVRKDDTRINDVKRQLQHWRVFAIKSKTQLLELGHTLSSCLYLSTSRSRRTLNALTR